MVHLSINCKLFFSTFFSAPCEFVVTCGALKRGHLEVTKRTKSRARKPICGIFRTVNKSVTKLLD